MQNLGKDTAGESSVVVTQPHMRRRTARGWHASEILTSVPQLTHLMVDDTVLSLRWLVLFAVLLMQLANVHAAGPCLPDPFGCP